MIRTSLATAQTAYEFDHLTAVSDADVWDVIFRDAAPESFIAIATERRESWRPDPYIHPLVRVRVSDRHLLVGHVMKYLGPPDDMSVQTACSTFHEERSKKHRGNQEYTFDTAAVQEAVAIDIDIDVGRIQGGPSAEDALALTKQLIAARRLPCPTLAACSGRGLHLLYVIAPTRLDAVRIELRRQVVGRLCNPFHGLLPIDENASAKVAGLFKAPGSPSRIGPVKYKAFFAPDRTTKSYTLEALAELLQVRTVAADTAPRQPRSSRNRTAEAVVAPMRRRMEELRRLVPCRSGWVGLRHYLLLAYGEASRRYFVTIHGLEEGTRLARADVHDFNERLPQPEMRRAVEDVLRSKIPHKPQRSETIVKALSITHAETEAACLVSLADEQTRRSRDAEKSRQKAEKAALKSLVRDLLSMGHAPAAAARIAGVPLKTVYRWRRAR